MTIGRRGLIAAGACTVATSGILRPNAASAAATREQVRSALGRMRGRTLVVANWGGAYAESQRKALLEPFSQEFGIRVIEDGPPTNPRIAAMVQSGNVTWDVASFGAEKVDAVGRENLLADLDYGIIDAGPFRPNFATRWGVGFMTYSMVTAWRRDVFRGEQPARAADFWDFRRFPGRRSMKDEPQSTIPFALLAAGVPRDQVYPMTAEKVERGLAKLAELGDNVLWWQQPPQSIQHLLSREASMVHNYNGRLDAPIAEGQPLGVMWEDAQLFGDSWCIPRGSRNAELAMHFIAWSCFAENNVRISSFITYGPANRDAFDMVPADRRAILPTSHVDRALVTDNAWWGEHLNVVTGRWQQWRLTRR